jgi:hypothetical protein
MKVVIDISDASKFSLTPYMVYNALINEYWKKQISAYGNNFWGMVNACDTVARECYARETERRPNVKNLILTYTDAENCFKIYKMFVDVWVAEIINNERGK